MIKDSKLVHFKEQISALENHATKETISHVSMLIKQISSYISIHVKPSSARNDAFEQLEILHNYLSETNKDGNDTVMIVAKEMISTIIDSLDEEGPGESKNTYDVFISHASKDKVRYVNELRNEIKRLGVTVFYDTDVIGWGDDWKKVILDATEKSEFVIVVISQNFFGREWTERELSEFMHKQNDTKQKVVLPLLYNVSPEDVIQRYPYLEDIQYIETAKYTKKEIAILFAKQYIERIKSKQLN